ncbi:MAG: glycoside hydrolase family 3 C-terminal domain-containing protein [Oscillospiraceae bacterium]|nr:glycoside hydrolase family 3 C-terminal domain-containing protein [Oscillospiraceae bacterium]
MTNQTELLSQDEFINPGNETLKLGEISAEYIKACRDAATEGIVLLENNGVLPISEGTTLSVFGRVQYDYFYVGYGSGGDVRKPYAVSLMEALKANPHFNINEKLAEEYQTWCAANVPDEGEWGKWPTNFDEMPMNANMVNEAATSSDTAIVVIGRSAGEDRESLLAPGSYYLTDAENEMLDLVTDNFSKVVVIIDAGNTIDLSWTEVYGDKIDALLYAWQGGMESGNAVADVLSGAANPSGKLTSTIARYYKDYPTADNFNGEIFNNYAEDIYVGYRYFETFAKDVVLYPFGYGLTYTDFITQLDGNIAIGDEKISAAVKVTNKGMVSGKQVVQLYYSAPQGVLGKPALELAGFAKTRLLKPSESEVVTVTFNKQLMASYDDAGKTGHKSAYVLEPGDYEFFIGEDVRNVNSIGKITVHTLELCEQLTEVAAVNPNNAFDRLIANQNQDGALIKAWEKTPTRTVNLKERILSNLPTELTQTTDTLHFDDVVNGKITMDDFVGSLNAEELEALTRGDYIMNSPLGSPGNAGVFGGTIQPLRDKGVIPITTSDGPSGVRLQYECALLPCGTALASSWNMTLLEKLATFNGAELTEKGSHVLLAPGMNIMRDPLCGRNFEYFSEDPILNGLSATAMVKGIQKHGHSACPKHYVCNNQETFRTTNDSRLSERALREIYLKGFEICVKESNPKNLMTSYNKINGVWGHYHYELCMTILRGEWDYQGSIITDWWMQPCEDPDFELLTNDAYRVRAGVDVLMPGAKSRHVAEGDGSLLASYEKGGITLAEMQRTAKNVLNFVLVVRKGK